MWYNVCQLEREAEQLAKSYKHHPEIEISNEARAVLHDGRFIRVYTHNNHHIEYFNYTEDLFRVLATPSLCSFSAAPGKRTQVELMQVTRERNGRRAIYLGPFAYNYYGSGMSATEYLLHAVEMRDHLRNDLKLQVDHVDNNSHNHCKWNLKAISGEQNGPGAKGSLVAQVKWPYFVSPCVHESGEYLIEYGYYSFSNGCLNCMYMRCPTEDALVSFLRTVFGWLPPVEEEYDNIGSALDALHYSKIRGIPPREGFACSSFEFAVKSYDRKMEIPLDEYPVWII